MRNLLAIQGIKGSYSEEAARKLFPEKNARILECLNFEQTFAAVLSKQANYAVVPFKNKIVGEIETTHILLKQTDLRILEELSLEIRHVLVGTKDARFENLKSVCSHVEALKQCRIFLSKNQKLREVIGADTASSVRRVVEEYNAANAAIGSRRAAEIYGAKILKENVADALENWTTFYLLGN